MSAQELGVILAGACIGTSLSYLAAIFVLSRKKKVVASASGDEGLVFVFLMTCWNEERVLAESLNRLMTLPSGGHTVVVVDDASDDRTPDIVNDAITRYGSASSGQVHARQRLRLHRRQLPAAHLGKGAALNDGLAYLRRSGLLDGRDPADVIVCVVDADGRLDEDVLSQVTPHFADPRVGGVQIGVRMYNRDSGLLARLQDVEFVSYADIFQVGKCHLGSVGLGGNGQFMRLAALDRLPGPVWSDCLTEDLDLGIRLLAAGWINDFCPTVAVSQQAVVHPWLLVRQRSRWFQGHMQAARLGPLILRGIPSRRATADLLYHLSSPVLILLTSLLPLSFLLGLLGTGLASLAAHRNEFSWWWLPSIYLLSFGVAHAYGYVYWRRERDLGLARCLLIGHAFVLYGYLWFVAGWWAVIRMLRGHHGWLKTART